MRKSIPKLHAQILEEATAWFIDFNEEEVDQAGREAFNVWLRRSPEHVRAFLQISAFWEDASAFGRRRNLDLDDLIERAKAEHNVYSLELTARDRMRDAIATAEEQGAEQHSSAAPQERSRSKRWWLATAASILVSLGVGTFAWYTLYRAPTYATEIGEQRSITLEDGSSVELNARSSIRVRFTQSERFVDLLEGQVLFTVAKNPARPFIVATGDSHVRAVGTQFDVYRKRTGTLVTVVEGSVAVAPQRTNAREPEPSISAAVQREGSATREVQDETSSARLSGEGPGVRPGEVLLAAGEQLMITPISIGFPKPVNLAVATAWTDKRLVFDSTPLREVVEEFNRYNRQQLIIRDPELYDFHISGVFPSTDSNRMVEFLRQRFGVTMNRSGDEIEISRRVRSETGSDSATLLRNASPEKLGDGLA